MDRKGRKRKEREKKVWEKKQRALEKKLEERRAHKRYGKLFDHSDEVRDRLECEVLLATVGLETNPERLREARSFLDRLSTLGKNYDVLGMHLDGLFALAHGKIPRKYAAKLGIDCLASQLLRNIRGILETFEPQVAPLFASPIGERVCSTDALDAALRVACDAKRAAILDWGQQHDTALNKFSAAGGLPHDDGEASDETLTYEFMRDFLVEAVTRPMERIRRWQLGVPTDFYRDITQLAGEIAVSATCFFLRQLYTAMTADELHPILQREKDSLDMIRFGYVLQLEPEKYLPDPEYLTEQKALARRLNTLAGGDSAISALELLHAAGDSYGDALAKLERLGSGQQTFGVAREMLSSCGEWGAFLLDLCCEHPNFIGAYETLRATRHNPEQSAAFLRDFGDYQIGDATLSEVIQRHGRRPEAVRLLVENALYFCCGEGAEDMVALLDDLPKSTKALRHYMGFATTEEPYKQLAVLWYLKYHGVEELETFAKNLQRHRDDRVGAMLHEADDQTLLCRVAAEAEPEAAAAHPLRDLASFDLIVRYDLTPEIADLDLAAVSVFDAVLCRLRGSRFESMLLGQGHLRQQFIACLRRDAPQIAAELSRLPSEGNPYLVLKRILIPPTAVTPAAAEYRPPYERMVLISTAVDPETIAYLEDELRIPIHVIGVDAAGTKFTAIRHGDVVVFDTTRTSHLAYYRAKNLATRRGATFRHAARTHRDALVELVRS